LKNTTVIVLNECIFRLHVYHLAGLVHHAHKKVNVKFRDGRISGSGIRIRPVFALTGEIRIRPDCMWHGGSDFHKLQYSVLH